MTSDQRDLPASPARRRLLLVCSAAGLGQTLFPGALLGLAAASAGAAVATAAQSSGWYEGHRNWSDSSSNPSGFATYLGSVQTAAALQTTDLPLSQLPLSGDTARELIDHFGAPTGQTLPVENFTPDAPVQQQELSIHR